MDVKVAVVSGLKNAAEVLDKIRSGEADYQFIEVMCCPGGCVNGGGQPIQPASVWNFNDVKALRAKALYDEDKAMKVRKSHENPRCFLPKKLFPFTEKNGILNYIYSLIISFLQYTFLYKKEVRLLHVRVF